ncbi:MAG: HD domain-containing protein [Symploca sp. SIO2G7]|nr:HD domain-containing protein [Symploca sp. SIO2G7]
MRDQVLTWLSDNVPASRLQHILGVEQMAAELAEYHYLDVAKAAQAGLMHDLAKYFKPNRLLQMARTECQSEGWKTSPTLRIEIDPLCEANPYLLHADVSAIVARDEFGIQDEEVLAAIANHTLGRPGMSSLSILVFLADSLEPNRGDTPELAALRLLCRQNLYQAVWRTCDYGLSFLLNSRRFVHPRTILTRNWALHMFNQGAPKDTIASSTDERDALGAVGA